MYFVEVIISAIRAVIWPPGGVAKVVHAFIGFVIFSTWYGVELRAWLERVMLKFGFAIEPWHYVLAAGIMVGTALAIRVALLVTPKIRAYDLRVTEDDKRYYVKTRIKNRTSVHLMVLAELTLSKGSKTLAIDGRDRFVLLTHQRLFERSKRPEKDFERRRFNLGAFETKDVEIIAIDKDKNQFTIYDELGPVEIPPADYHLRLLISHSKTVELDIEERSDHLLIWGYLESQSMKTGYRHVALGPKWLPAATQRSS